MPSRHALVDPHRLKVTVCHYPGGASKWNPIDHRLFSEISKNWAAVPLRDYATILNHIRTTTTDTGLSVVAQLVEQEYPTGVRIADAEFASIALQPHQTQTPAQLHYLSPLLITPKSAFVFAPALRADDPVSIHAPARGGDIICRTRRTVAALFQSTPPHGGRRHSSPLPVRTVRVSIHAPARGATLDSQGADFARVVVSIHAPARGATRSWPPQRQP